MHPVPPRMSEDEEHLGVLAMRFRGTRREAERRAIVMDYSETVRRLIDGGNWREMPAPEDQLPDDYMPKRFFEYWGLRQGDAVSDA